ncbi:hypothetical protein GYMLUDRAFT_250642 [Collybiopsis luxurians FD-317 M1]|uniref:Uncharacterized protein n=1 Tax=Collybiopsis luxurians FD-317 M1 TaxID=944289 RepID=A0A0D0CDN7_9AGAR|nr:hypothetical protein GYMLUDRAFT_250642 [Collybiopsis luxurians FD-317 M1]
MVNSPLLLDQMEMYALQEGRAMTIDRLPGNIVRNTTPKSVSFAFDEPSNSAIPPSIPASSSASRSLPILSTPSAPANTRSATPGPLTCTGRSPELLAASYYPGCINPDVNMDEFSDAERAGKIPKPTGEVARPGRGGYNLEGTLKWPKAQLDHVKGFIKKQHLLQDIREQAVVKYPFLAARNHKADAKLAAETRAKSKQRLIISIPPSKQD